MKHKQLIERNLPDQPGVYLFLGSKGEILYIGKATSLRDRTRSYFARDLITTRGPLIVQMVGAATGVDYRKTDSVLEALILEASLIKEHRPPYNIRDKDDKSYNYLVITREEYPRVLVARGKDLDETFAPSEIKYVFGPFPQGGLFKDAVKIVRKIFPFRDTCTPFDTKLAAKSKPCFNAQIGLCPGICDGSISKKEYGRMIQHIKLFFEGKKSLLLKQLQREMKAYAKAQEFEKADDVKQKIFALNHIQDVTLIRREVRDMARAHGIFRIEAYDVAHISGEHTTGVMVVVENGEIKKTDYRKFRIRSRVAGNDIAALQEMLERRFNHTEWRLPNVIAVDGGKAQIHAAQEVLHGFGYVIPILSVVKDERHRPREILGEKALRTQHERSILLANGEAHRFAISYHKQRRTGGFLPE